MGQLNNLYVSSSYQGLLKMTDSTSGLTGTLQTIQAGDGSNSPLQMSLTEVNISGSFYINNVPITNGTNGTSGTSGTNGSNGTDGTSGSSGSNGTDGTSGTNGSSGTSGSNGTNGSSGSNGSDGSSGTSGSNGTNGSSGSSGTDGSSGTSGSNGTNGTSGSNGTDGTSGTNGSNGTNGTSGTSFQSPYTGDIVVTGSIDITGQYLVNGVPVSGSGGGGDRNGLITTGSIGTSQFISGSLTDFGGNIFIVQSGQTIPFRITGSEAGGNIIMGLGNDPLAPQSQLTGSWSITGSNNIIMNGLIPDENYSFYPGSKAYLSGSNNIIFGQPSTQNGILVQSSSVMLPTMNSNILGGYVNLTFTSSSLAKPTFSNNIGAGTINVQHQSGSVSMNGNFGNGSIISNANKTTLGLNTSITNNLFTNGTTLNHNSSSISYQGNLGGQITVNNNYSSSVSNAVNNITVGQNTFGGIANTILVSGSNSGTRRTFGQNIIYGRSNEVNSIYSGSFTGGHLVATSILGQNLIVSASHILNGTGGSTFVGRFNATGSLQESSQETVFVVGTGTNAANRRNALRIDNNNNSNFTGSVNISGSLLINGSITGPLTVNGSQSIIGAANSLSITGNAGRLVIDSGSINLNNDGQSQITNQQAGTNVMYVDATNKNFFFGNVPKAQSGRFSGDTGNFIVSPTYAAFETGSNNVLLGTAGIGLVSGSNNLRIGGEPNFGSSDYSDTLYIGGSGGVNTNIIQKNGASSPLQLGYNTQVTGSLDVSNGATITGSLRTTGQIRTDDSLIVIGDIQTNNIINVGTAGDITIKPSSPFKVKIEANTEITGSVDITGSLKVTNLPNATGSYFVMQDATGSLSYATPTQALPVLFAAGAFYSTGSVTTTAGVSGSFVYDSTIDSQGITYSGSQITVSRTGLYNIQFSTQIDNGASSSDVAVWLKKNGSNIADTATILTVPSNHKDVLALNLWDNATAGDYYELTYQSTTSNTSFASIAASGNIPASPSIIVTVNQIR